MIDRETMIRALKCISADPDYEGACNDCPYLESCKNEDEYYLPFCDEKRLAADALALLREQAEIIDRYRKADAFLYAHGWRWNNA